MTPLVVDASALIDYLLRTPGTHGVEVAIRAAASTDLNTPALCDVECMSVLRRALLAGRLTVHRAEEAVEDLLSLRVTRHDHRPLPPRILRLRENFSAYDAAYIALAERLNARLLTTDGALARAVRAHLTLLVVET